jgi:uncharacterized protein YceK
MNRFLIFNTAILFLILTSPGCGTILTASHFTIGSPKIYSGVRMDMDAMTTKPNVVRKKYNVDPLPFPMLDIPFSFLLDTILILPMTLPLAIGDDFLMSGQDERHEPNAGHGRVTTCVP